MFKPILLFLLICPFVQAQDASPKRAQIDELFRLTRVDQMSKQIIAQIRSLAAQQLSSAATAPKMRADAEARQEKIFAFIEREFSFDTLKPSYVKLYDEAFTAEELDGMISFYKSPAGKAMLDKMPGLMAKSMAISQEKLKELAPRIEALVRESVTPPTPPAAKE